MKFLGRNAAMWKRSVLSKADKDPTLCAAERLHRRRAIACELFLRHSFPHRVMRRFVSHQSDLVGLFHQCDFGRRLEHTATRSDWCRADILKRGRGLANTVEQILP